MKTLGQRGLGILELLISTSIGVFLLISVLSVTLNGISIAKRNGFVEDASLDGVMLADYFSREVPSAGGFGIPMRGALFVENDCVARGPFPACAKSDRLSLIRPREISRCRVIGKDVDWLLMDKTPTCCLNDVDLKQKQTMLLKNSFYGQRHVAEVDLKDCKMRVEAGPLSINDNVVDTPIKPYDWTNAAVLRVELNTYYWDSKTNELMRYAYKDDRPEADFGVPLTIADRIFDFQITLGYDFDPTDGVVIDKSSNSDEWLYNAKGSAEVMGVGTFKDTPDSTLRMVGLGFIGGSPAGQGGGAAHGSQILDGPDRVVPNWKLTPVLSKLGIRTIYLFQ